MLIGRFCSLTRRRVLYGFATLLAIGLALIASVYLSRPRIVVGRSWPSTDRRACGDISHQLWGELLQRFVDADGNVDYTAWKNSSDNLRQLDEYFDSLSRMDEYRPATKSQRLAFWINAYNAVTVRGILREYPTSSIQKNVTYLWGYNIWRDLRLIVGDTTYSLGEIEHTVLRPLGEPRIHFAIVCGSHGCPRLLNQAITAELLDEQLQRNTLAFFADPSKCAIDARQNELLLSPILKWYATDFGDSTSEMLRRIADWLPDKAKSLARSNNVRLTYVEYDWALNDQATTLPPLPSPE